MNTCNFAQRLEWWLFTGAIKGNYLLTTYPVPAVQTLAAGSEQ